MKEKYVRMARVQIAAFITLTGVLGLGMPSIAFGALINNSQLNIAGDTVLGTTSLNWKCDSAGRT